LRPAFQTRIALVGDLDEAKPAHRAIPIALADASERLQRPVVWEWLHTATIDADAATRLEEFDAVWCIPVSQYANAAGALAAIEFARLSLRPFLGTCGGFQHALLEYARAFWGIERPANAETDPAAADPVIAPLECPLVDVSDVVYFVRGSRLARIYGAVSTSEEYRCRYGLSVDYAARLQSGQLRVAARDARDGVVAVEHTEHPFFVAALFQPERAALAGRKSPLVSAFVLAAAQRPPH